ncbi:MAG: SDR family NAD(P)-dependent oxidoreductase [Myxococcales bacterium]|nr:SDR family NAD(P)-dependent oxidoreductase [Myxococcales bacterium]
MQQMRQVVITGGTGYLGQAVVRHMVALGAQCHVTWKHAGELERFEHRDTVTLHQVDCENEAAVVDLYAGLDQVDASIHLVGGFAMAEVGDTSLAMFEQMWRLNSMTTFLCCREAVRAMRRGQGGRIVNVAARPAVEPSGGMVAYAAAKASVASLTQCLADEVASDAILVNAVVPSIMDTPANRKAMPEADHASWPSVDQVAQAVGFLAGTDNALTTGALLPVYGVC